jgi:predicted RNA-binding Zn ribbon-like protein
VTPDTLVQLANLGVPRRPARAPTASSEPVLPDPGTADRQLASLISRPVTAADLPALRRVHQAAARAAEALLAGRFPDCAALNALASGSSAHIELVASGRTLRQHLVWHDPSPAAELARRLINEIAALDPNRLRRCARTTCGLLFYDTTRSRTRRWHAEDPCGWRERQQQRRTNR